MISRAWGRLNAPRPLYKTFDLINFPFHVYHFPVLQTRFWPLAISVPIPQLNDTVLGRHTAVQRKVADGEIDLLKTRSGMGFSNKCDI